MILIAAEGLEQDGWLGIYHIPPENHCCKPQMLAFTSASSVPVYLGNMTSSFWFQSPYL